MDSSLISYLQRLELMGFFSAYPLLYSIVMVIAGSNEKRNFFKKQLVALLPFTYALLGTLYLGLQLKNYYPDYSFHHIKLEFEEPLLKIWGLISLLFWIPAIRKKPILSLIHSLVFFFFLARDLFLQSLQLSADNSVVRNDMKIFTDSLLLNFCAFAAMAIIYFFIRKTFKRTPFTN